MKARVAAGVLLLVACGGRESSRALEQGSGGSESGSPPAGGAPMAAPTGMVSAGAGAAAVAGQGACTSGSGAFTAGGAPTGGGASAGSNEGGSDETQAPEPVAPYAPRSGPFKAVAYSRTTGYRHQSSIAAGRALLTEIAKEQGFELLITEENDFLADLDGIELVIFLNPSGSIFNPQEKTTFEAWMARGGAFVGTHSATDVENGWPFYTEVTGQYHNGHSAANTPATVELELDMLEHPALKGLPNPWQRNEEWFLFNSFAVWMTKPGFQILARVWKENAPYDGHPVAWVREWGGFRAFYTSLGHDAAVYADPLFEQHLTGGLMWAVRRSHLLK